MTPEERNNVKIKRYTDSHGVDRVRVERFDLTVIGEKDGAPVLYRKPKSDHPAEGFLELVLAYQGRNWVVWTHNLQTGGYAGGLYHPPTLDGFLAALRDYDDWGVRTRLSVVAERILEG